MQQSGRTARILINGIASDYVSAGDRGLHYGDGLFETIACTGNSPLLIEHHLDRMEAGARTLGIAFPDRSLILDDINAVLRDRAGNSVVKLLLTRGRAKRGYRYQHGQIPTRICMLADWPDYIERWHRDGIAAQFCETPVSVNPKLAGFKTLNRLENVLGAGELASGVDEGFMLDPDGNVIEGTMSNLFAVLEEALVTPDLSRCGINGIMRARIIDIAHTNAIKVEIRNIGRDELTRAREIFICNSVIGICAVKQLEQGRYTTHEITQTIKAHLNKRMQADAKAAA
jgi:4-amino-4-deoxychorismate lyase